ncbi:response regulator transcription factor [Paenibacillus sp. JDR-2]|uniref:response regulator transcription factor n=1 Tax=Paenibacillus sp. (strain JDR-2) TaxID=324057 RepID=UPI000166B0DF|nr:response regulator [Paenibacillus sp. JDR-2]ACS99367.1 two component transcriptional regulator, AraC family [Paenibacillus sp. JDR-2]
MQLLIVDDEAHWVENLSMHKPWHTLGIEYVHRAYSAREALQIIGTNPIDIVISDVLMPEMTGIELIERIREQDKRIKCIILSGHADFEYAKEALRHHAVDYLLKPPTNEELLGAAQTAIDQLKAEWENVSSQERTQFALRENLPLLRGQLLLGAFRGERIAEEEWIRKLDMYGLPFRSGSCALALVRLEDEFGHYRGNGQHLVEYAIMNIAEEILQEFMGVWSVKEEHGYLAFLLQAKEHPAVDRPDILLEKLAMQIQAKVKQFLKGAVSVVVTDSFLFPEELPEQYRQAVSYFRQIVGDEQEFVMKVDGTRKATAFGALDVIHGHPGLLNLAEAGRWEAAEDKLAAAFDELEDKGSESWEHCLEMGYTISSAFMHLAHRSGHTLADLIGPDMELLQSGEAFASIGKLRKWSLNALAKLREGTAHDAKNARSQYVQKIRDYVDKHLHLDVSLRALADYVNLHPTHLSKIYKLETGEGISDYVASVRMERACHLLKATDKKIYEISADIGYLDPAYFIKVFKRQFDVTPQEYRDGR